MKRKEDVLKAKRIVYQMSQELRRTDVEDDFQNALLSLEMDKTDKTAGFNAFLHLQNRIKESLKAHLASGTQDDLLSLLTARQMRSVTQMFHNPSIPLNPSLDGETIKAKRIQVVEHFEEFAPKMPNIPRLDVEGLGELEEEQESVSSNPGRSSGRAVQIQQPAPVPVRKIPSKPRPVKKFDAEIQTDDVEVEVEKKMDSAKEKEKIDTVETGTNCRLLTTPRVEEDVILSPISTMTDTSEGEVTGFHASRSHVTIVRTDGSIVPPQKIDNRYFGDSDIDILRATSSSPLRVVEVDMSVSSTPTRSQC